MHTWAGTILSAPRMAALVPHIQTDTNNTLCWPFHFPGVRVCAPNTHHHQPALAALFKSKWSHLDLWTTLLFVLLLESLASVSHGSRLSCNHDSSNSPSFLPSFLERERVHVHMHVRTGWGCRSRGRGKETVKQMQRLLSPPWNRDLRGVRPGAPVLLFMCLHIYVSQQVWEGNYW